jgi:RNA polymerase sigma factor (sigma-70 family)
LKNTNHNISLIILACREGNRAAQKRLYQLFFSYGMSVALRYSSARTEAEEILNESFFKVFSKIDQYDENNEFKKWFRSILINTSIDYHRKYKKLKTISSEKPESLEVDHNTAWEGLLYEDLLKVIQLLSPGYRVVFNLYAIDGYKHQEIAEQLNISVGTSRSNYAKARKLLQGHLEKMKDVKKASNGK